MGCMLIEIPDNLEKYLLGLSDPFSEEALALNTLFDSMIKNHHIVFASLQMLETIGALPIIHHTNKYYIEWLISKRVTIYSCIQYIKKRIVITNENRIVNKGDYYCVPLRLLVNLRETKFLTEHESDGLFYQFIFVNVMREKGLSQVFSLSLENDSCHGSNVGAKIEQSASDEKMAFCLLDSDKDFPNDSYGSTYKGALRKFKKLRKTHVIGLEVLEVREKENLLPPKWYLNLELDEQKKHMLNVLNNYIDKKSIYGYFDLKDGIKAKRISESKWLDYFSSVVDELNILEIYDEDNVDDDYVLLEGLGDKKCTEAIEKCRDEKYTDLPNYLIKEWNRIFFHLFSWGCALSQEYRPVGKTV